MSVVVIEPKSLPSAPARAVRVMRVGTSVVAISWAAARSLASRTSRARRIAAAWARPPPTPSWRGPWAGGSCGRSRWTRRRCRRACRRASTSERRMTFTRRPPPRPRVSSTSSCRSSSNVGAERLVDASSAAATARCRARQAGRRGGRRGRPVALRTERLGDPAGVGQQRHLAGVLDGPGDLGCCWESLPVTRRARILARSDMNRRSRLTSL